MQQNKFKFCLFLGVEVVSRGAKFLRFSDCIGISCERSRRTNRTYHYEPGAYYVCNEKQTQTLQHALCSSNLSQPENWFKASSLQVFMADNQDFSDDVLLKCTRQGEFAQQSSQEFCYRNSSNCLTKDVSKLLGKTPCRMDYRCTNVSIYRSKKKSDVRWARTAMEVLAPMYIILGLLAMFGNTAVIINCCCILRQPMITSKEIKAYNILLLNLAIADFLMSIYMIGLATGGLKYILSTIAEWNAASENDRLDMCTWIDSAACSLLGSINFLSGQSSVTALIAITALRLYGAFFPYKEISLKSVKLFVFISWIFWIILSGYPLLNIEPVKTNFADIVEFRHNGQLIKLRYFHLQYLLQNLLQEINRFCGLTDDGYSLSGRPSWKTLFTVAKNLNLFDQNELQELNYASYFTATKACAPRFLVHYNNKFFYFSFFIVTFNTAAFGLIFLGQLAIAKKTFKVSPNRNAPCSCWYRFLQLFHKVKNPLEELRETENKRIRRRMFLIVVTDFCCWIPISVISIFYNFHTSVQDLCVFLTYRQTTEGWFYAFTLITVPINSVINPFIYSYTTQKRVKSMFLNCFTKMRKKQAPQNMPPCSVTTVSSTV